MLISEYLLWMNFNFVHRTKFFYSFWEAKSTQIFHQSNMILKKNKKNNAVNKL